MYRFVARHKLTFGVTLLACLSSGFFVLVVSRVEQGRANALNNKQDAAFAKLDEAVRTRLAKQKATLAAEAKERKTAEATQSKQSSLPSTRVPSVNFAHYDPHRLDIVVNKKHPLNPRDFVPSLSTVTCAGRGSTTISTEAVADFQALCQAAVKAALPLDSSSSYRSYQTQVSTYNYWVSVSGKSGADTYSARAGYSEHQTGLAVDFRVPGGATLSDFTGTPQQKWLAKNAWRYGFIQRYTNSNQRETGYTAESWHYRYLGREAAEAYTASHTNSLESYWGISGGDYE